MTIQIQDLSVSKELNQAAMSDVRGGDNANFGPVVIAQVLNEQTAGDKFAAFLGTIRGL